MMAGFFRVEEVDHIPSADGTAWRFVTCSGARKRKTRAPRGPAGRSTLGAVRPSCCGCRGGATKPNGGQAAQHQRDRKSTRLNSSHVAISYAVFCLKKKKVHEKKNYYNNNIKKKKDKN